MGHIPCRSPRLKPMSPALWVEVFLYPQTQQKSLWGREPWGGACQSRSLCPPSTHPSQLDG